MSNQYYLIRRQTLVDIADAIRRKSGTTGEIPVTSLAERILALGDVELKKLATPNIYLEATSGKLTTPTIYLETSGGTSEGGNTTAILGQAILGKAILGNNESGDTPAITKLATPTIYLETIDDSEPEEPDEPEIVELNTPNIWLEIVSDEPDEPVVVKLSAPNIYLETIEEEITELAPPTNVKYDATTKMLSWDAVEGATDYWVKTDAGFSPPNTTLLEEDISIIFRVCSNIGQTEVNVTVIACNESLMSEPSESINFKILRKPTIELMEDEPEAIKLETPSIYLETI